MRSLRLLVLLWLGIYRMVALLLLHQPVQVPTGHHADPADPLILNDHTAAQATFGRIEPPARMLAMLFKAEAGDRFRARMLVPITDPNAGQFNPALLLLGPGAEVPELDAQGRAHIPFVFDLDDTSPYMHYINLPLEERTIWQNRHGRPDYHSGAIIDTTLPQSGYYLLLMLPGTDTPCDYMLATGYTER